MVVGIRSMVNFADTICIPVLFRAEVLVTKTTDTQKTDGLEFTMHSKAAVAHSLPFVSIHIGCCRVVKEQTINMRFV